MIVKVQTIVGKVVIVQKQCKLTRTMCFVADCTSNSLRPVDHVHNTNSRFGDNNIISKELG